MMIKLPFDGFYESISDMLSTDAAAMYFSRGDDTDFELRDEDFDKVNWSKLHNGIAFEYTKHLCSEAKIEWDVNSFKLSSPKFYNFETDAILVDIRIEELKRLRTELESTARAELVAFVNEKLKPCSGFAPFYGNDYNDSDEWGDELDPPQWGLVVEAYIRFVSDVGDEFERTDEFMEHERSNGNFEQYVV